MPDTTCDFVFACNDGTGHLVLRSWTVIIGGAKFTGDAKELRTSPAWRYALLALGFYRLDGRTRFPTSEKPWKPLKDSLRKLNGVVQRGEDELAADWTKKLFGGAQNVLRLFEIKRASVEIATTAIVPANLSFRLEDRSDVDVRTCIQMWRDSVLASRISSKRSSDITALEPSKDLREAIIGFADELLDLRGVHKVQKLVVGKVIWFLRLSDLFDLFDEELCGTDGLLNTILDDLPLESVEKADELAPLSARVARSIDQCRASKSYAALMEIDLGPSIQALSKLQEQIEICHKMIELPQSAANRRPDGSQEETNGISNAAAGGGKPCGLVLKELRSRLHDCKDKLQRYVGAIRGA